MPEISIRGSEIVKSGGWRRRQKSISAGKFARATRGFTLHVDFFFPYINASDDPIKSLHCRDSNPGLGVQNEDRRPSGSSAPQMISRSGLVL